MTAEDNQAVLKLMAGGKNCQLIEMYSSYYTKITGKHRGGGCSTCNCNWLFIFLSGYIRTIK